MNDRAATTRAGELLAAYSDLRSAAGPIHARIVADLGTRLLSGTPLPSYQGVTPGLLRALISLDAPHVPYLEDPRQLAPHNRSEPWNFVCNQLDSWDDLSGPQRLRVAQVLTKLGFWQLVIDLVSAQQTGTDRPQSRPLAFLHATALFRLNERDRTGVTRMRDLSIAKAMDERLATSARISAALNVAVHYARTSGGIGDAKHWQGIAESFVSSPSLERLNPLLRSAYWRGFALIQFVEGNHAEVTRMMLRSEDCARQAIAEASDSESLAALENMNAVLETRARAAWTSGDLDTAERHFRHHLDHDPWDPKPHVRLADFLFATGRIDDARDRYHRAAALGAPYSIYARARLARCTSIPTASTGNG
ncbi:tetratricopeptide repeat protein [Nocardia sp. NBC_00403]|uniref:tetratricopeptide repeat protein n=1 Tax=Nocardia sp. NBC_00403 TaxID=2975990 RepID=UPI002E22C8A9